MKSNKNRTSVNDIRRINKKSEEAAKIWSEDEDEEIKSDILGSYTGNPSDNEKPVQDADDL